MQGHFESEYPLKQKGSGNGKKRKIGTLCPSAYLEAEMLLVRHMIHIAWIPSVTGKEGSNLSNPTLKGRFQVKMKGLENRGGSTTTNASIEWVKKHFRHCVLGVVQKVAYEVKEELAFPNRNVPKSRRHGYMNVEGEEIG
jgi:hypothetical protein